MGYVLLSFGLLLAQIVMDILNEIIIKAQKEKDALFFIRASCVLGELFFSKRENRKSTTIFIKCH
ncbi:hypothetical protein [Prevotella disiens]|uniref:hypothetical protein n=1 Tax=Prevotella disiens TaxID=28130 RepID=UPI0002E9C898|nr:hypothetical protein [Prevotella disiens]